MKCIWLATTNYFSLSFHQFNSHLIGDDELGGPVFWYFNDFCLMIGICFLTTIRIIEPSCFITCPYCDTINTFRSLTFCLLFLLFCFVSTSLLFCYRLEIIIIWNVWFSWVFCFCFGFLFYFLFPVSFIGRKIFNFLLLVNWIEFMVMQFIIIYV